MKFMRSQAGLAAVLCIFFLGITSIAGTNGFVVPSFRGSTNSEFGYWETFSVPVGAPGNRPDKPGATTDAILSQTNGTAFLTGSGNIYNLAGASSFTLADATSVTVGTVILQTRTIGSELDYTSILLTYSDDGGSHSLAPLFRYELDRTAGQGFNVSSLWQWDLTGLDVTNYIIVFHADGTSLSFDSLTLDTASQFSRAFPQQPFTLRSTPANLARWMYPFNSNPESRPTASVFGSLGSAPDFDSRDAQYLLGWNTTNQIPAGQGADHYLIRRARVTLTIASGNQYTYTGTLPDYRSYFPTNDPRHLPSLTSGSPVELFGAGFRGGYAATNYPQNGPWGISPNVYATNRIAYAAGFDTNGILVDVSNNVGDNGTDEIAAPFEVAPFAVGQSIDVKPGDQMPAGSQLTFDLNLEDPLIYRYIQDGLNNGNLSFMATSFIAASFSGPPTYPNFYTIFSPIATASQYPLLDLEGTIVRTNIDTDGDSLPDDWENFYFGKLGVGAMNDFDGDGASNLAEFQAGTNPTHAGSVFQVSSIQHEINMAELHFRFAPGREYTVRRSEDLKNWQTVTPSSLIYSSAWLAKSGTNIAYPSPVFSVWRDTNAVNAQSYYRIEER